MSPAASRDPAALLGTITSPPNTHVAKAGVGKSQHQGKEVGVGRRDLQCSHTPSKPELSQQQKEPAFASALAQRGYGKHSQLVSCKQAAVPKAMAVRQATETQVSPRLGQVPLLVMD